MTAQENRLLTAHVPLAPAEAADETASRLTHEALADVDAGRLIDHQAVVAWAASLETSP